jgi:hypothetical protein
MSGYLVYEMWFYLTEPFIAANADCGVTRVGFHSSITRLKRCTLWSTLAFARCFSCHITQIIVALMRSEGHSCTNATPRPSLRLRSFLHGRGPKSLLRKMCFNNGDQGFPLSRNNGPWSSRLPTP